MTKIEHIESFIVGCLSGLTSLAIPDLLPFAAKLVGAAVIAWVSGWAYAKGRKRGAGGQNGAK